MNSSGYQKELSAGERGSLLLMAMFSLSIGMLLSMLFVNMVRYVAATNAVEQAARVAARCVTPTDPECVSYAGANPSLHFNWFGVEYGPGGAKTYGEPHDYSAEMQTQSWQADYDTFQLHMVNPLVSYTALEVPVRTFETELNQHEYIYARIQGCGVDPWSNINYRQVYSPNFPSWILSNEQSFQNNDNWAPYRPNGNTISLPPVYNQMHGAFTISSGADISFSTPWIEVPALDGAPIPVGTACFNANGGDCSVDSGGSKSWRNFAYLAIKADASVQEISGNPQAKWESGSGSDGLVLTVRNEQGQVIRTTGLGGRDWSAPISGTDWYNLWLRGPAGSHGGNPAILHENLFVRRGHSFRITARMRAQGGTVRANIRLRAWFDDYNREEQGAPTEQCGDCGVFQQQPPIGTPDVGASIGAPSDCGLPASYVWRATNPFVISAIDSRTPSCTSDALTFVAPAATSNCQIEAAVCTDSWTPQFSLCPPPPLARLHCSWTIAGQNTETVGRAVGGCPLGSASPATAACNVERVLQLSENFGPLSVCSGGASEISSVNNQTLAINSNQPSGAPVFDVLTESDLSWSGYQEFVPEKWTFSWFPEDEFGNVLSSSAVIATNHNQVVNSSTIYKHVDSGWQPAMSEFPILSPIGEAAPASFLDHSVALSLLEEQSLPIDQVYPFIQTVYKIPDWGDVTDEWQYDYDQDCEVEQNCSGLGQVYESLEARLRSYAATQVPQASDPLVWFTYSAELSGEGPVEIPTEELSQLLECTPVVTHCWGKTETIVSLGTFSNLEFPEGPPECGGNTYGYCYSELSDDSYGDVEVSHEINDNLAVARAYAELVRLDSSTVLDSGEAHGASVDVEFGDDVAAEVTVTYRMPLTFPLNIILGREFLEVSHSKHEVLEMRIVGRESI